MANGKSAQTVDLDEEVPKTIDLDEEHQPSTAPTDEQIEAAYGKDVRPEMRKALKSGAAPLIPPTQFEQKAARPYLENLGMREPGEQPSTMEKLTSYTGVPVTPRMVKEGAKGAWELAKGTGGLAYDVGLGEYNPQTGEMEHGIGGLAGLNAQGEFAPGERAGAIIKKNIIEPGQEEWKKAGETTGMESLGHRAAAVIPFMGPWAAHLGERAGEGDIAGAAAETAGTIAGGELMAHAPEAVKPVFRKVAFGTPITEAGKLEAAKEQALTVKKPSMSETEYAGKVTAALPDLQQIAQENQGQIKTPRQAADAINRRIGQMEAPIGDHLAAHPEETVTQTDFASDMNRNMDQAMRGANAKLTPKEMDAAKKKVMELVGTDHEMPLSEIEKIRRRLNTDADDYFNSRPADKRVMDASDATAIAQRAAANYLRERLYGTDAAPGWLERAGVTAVDSAGRQVPIREFRRRVGNLIDIREHFEDAITKAEATGDWKAFGKLFTGPSIAAGGLGLLGGAAIGGPFGALLGTLGGEGLKAWGDYLRSKNPNLNVQKMFENLAETSRPTTVGIQTRAPIRIPAQGAIPPATGPALGPAAPPAPFQIGGQLPRPGMENLWATQVGGLPEAGFGPPGVGGRVEPITPETQWKLGAAGATAIPPPERTLPPPREQLPLPGAAELAHPEMFPQEPIGRQPQPFTFRKPAGAPGAGQMARGLKGEAIPPEIGRTAEGGPIRREARPEWTGAGPAPEIGARPTEIERAGGEVVPTGPPHTFGMEDLKVGDTFIDDKGEPRRIVEITPEGEIHTADGTARTYKNEIESTEPLNSTKAQLARGGKFIGEFPERPGAEEKVKPMEGPGKTLYHGTHTGIADSIKNEGLSQGMLTDSPELAREEAERSANRHNIKTGANEKPVVLQVKANPDEISDRGEIKSATSGESKGRYYERTGTIPAERISETGAAAQTPKTQFLASELSKKLNAKVVGSAVTSATPRDIDLRMEGRVTAPEIEKKMTDAGFKSRGSSLVSPEEAKEAGKPYAPGWNRVEHFERPDGVKVDVWHDDPESIVPDAINALKERVKNQTHAGEERDYKIHGRGDLDPTELKGATFILDDGSALEGDKGIKSHMQLASEVGREHLNNANAIRVVAPDAYELHGMPSDAQLAEMSRLSRGLAADMQRRTGRATPLDEIYWDFYPEDVKEYSAHAASERHESGAGKFSDFRRAIDKYYEPEAEKPAPVPAGKFTNNEVSTRVPSSVDAEDAHTKPMFVDMQGVTGAKGLAEKLSDTISKYPGMKRVLEGIKDPAGRIEAYINHIADNLTWLHNQMPEEVRNYTKQWYDSAHKYTADKAKELGYEHPQSAGVMASQSPQKDWNMNVSLHDRILNTFKNEQGTVTTPEMIEKMKELDKVETANKVKVAIDSLKRAGHDLSDKVVEEVQDLAKKGFRQAAFEALNDATGEDLKTPPSTWKGIAKKIQGKTLGELPSEYQAAWVRAFDQAHNPPTYQIYAPNGDSMGLAKKADGTPAKVAWGTLDSIEKAINILRDGSRENISKQLGEEHKVRNFYNNIISPNSENPHVTIDTHAVAAGRVSPFSGKSTEVAHNFGGPGSATTGSSGTYPLIAEAYKRAAEKLGLRPRELQSIVWEQIRDLFPDTFKTAENQKAVEKIWKDFGDKKISLDDARKKVVGLAGGFKEPEWLAHVRGR